MAIGIGDIVWLKSGSPVMTVNKVGVEGKPDSIICMWFPDVAGEPMHYAFHVDTLTSVKPGRHALA